MVDQPKQRTYEEVVLLMKVCADGSPQDSRDVALFAVGYHCAPRIAETSNLKLADLDLATGALTIHKGKGSKPRQGFLSGGALQAVRIGSRSAEPMPAHCSRRFARMG